MQYWQNLLLHRPVHLLIGIFQRTLPDKLAREYELPQAVPESLALQGTAVLTEEVLRAVLDPAVQLGSAAVREDVMHLLHLVRCIGAAGVPVLTC